MKRVSGLIILVLFLSIHTFGQFSVVSTKLFQNASYSNIYTSFLTPATTAKNENFPSSFGALAVQENIVDARVLNGATVEARASVSPMQNGDILTSNLSFYALFQDSNQENCQVRISIKLLYEIRNDGAAAADLFYGLNPKIIFAKNGSFAAGSGSYNLQLRESDALGTSGTLIHNSVNMEVSMNNNIRGTAYTNVPSGATRYVLLEIWVYAASENGLGSIFLVDASQGVSVGFDNEAVPIADGLNNDPFIDVNAKMKFQVHNLIAKDNTGPLMGNTGAFAYDTLTWDNDLSSGYAIAENTVLLNNVGGITITMENFHLVDFDPTVEVNAGFGSGGDRRTYVDGVAKIYLNGVLKLEIVDCRIGMNVDYPTPIGTGSEATGGGWGRISAANSDPAWFAEFNENNTEEVEFVFHSFSTVVNNPFYDAVISIVPSEYRDDYVGWEVSAAGGIVDAINNVGISMNFRSVSELGRSYARLITTTPGGTLPSGVNSLVTSQYWELGATFSTFSVDVTFDFSSITNLGDISNVRMLHRETASDTWTVLSAGSYTINGNSITVGGISDFSQFAVSSTELNPQPVELTMFTANSVNDGVILNWTTATEVNNYGFEIERSSLTATPVETWETIGFVEGHGNSNSSNNYTFIDRDITVAGDSLNYRLKQIDFDGGFEYSDILTIDRELNKIELYQNHPNPFNPSTQITFTITEAVPVQIVIYNVLGEKVIELVNEDMKAGLHSINFNGNDLTSGSYFYRLTTPKFSKTMKMILLR